MPIVYFSIAVIVASVIYLGIIIFLTIKNTKPSITRLQETANRLQAKSDAIKQETEMLSATQLQMKQDIEQKKKAINTVIFSVKQSGVVMKRLMQVKPVAFLERQFKAKQWKRNRRKQTVHSQFE